ncbi:MAG: hypothetical protein HQ551_07860 [Desulfobacteraceae bacterium]|nr:hypothetical protein [Desulfobacteraceae bacterium]
MICFIARNCRNKLYIACFIFIAIFLATACGGSHAYNSSSDYGANSILAQVLDREKVGDIKLSSGDRSYVDEYQIAIGMAVARVRKVENEIRDAIYASRALGHQLRIDRSYINWRQKITKFLASIGSKDRRYFEQKIANMSSAERQSVSSRFITMNSLARELSADKLYTYLDEWHSLMIAAVRIKRKCNDKCG